MEHHSSATVVITLASGGALGAVIAQSVFSLMIALLVGALIVALHRAPERPDSGR